MATYADRRTSSPQHYIGMNRSTSGAAAAAPLRQPTATSRRSAPPTRRSRSRCNAGAVHARRIRIAKGMVSGKTMTAIAREEGISRQWASREAHSPAMQQILVPLLEAHSEELGAMFGSALEAMKAAMQARRVVTRRVKNAKGKMTEKQLDLGPDHWAALAGVKAFTKFWTMIMGRGR
jgi:hypothetical protein